MIDPLLYAEEQAPPHNIDRAVFCGACLDDRKLKLDPQIASKYCHDCGRIKYYCLSCDAREHGQPKMRHHIQSLVVVGPPVRKKMISRGDATNYPMFLDKVKIHFSAKVYDNGKLVHRESPRYLDFQTGLSGDSIHVQVLGCRNLIASDLHASSDPFVTGTYRGVQIGCTRTRHRTCNPRWSNETFVVPIGDSLPDVRIMQISQEDLLRLEVFDYDMFSANDFLGQVELTKQELIDMAKLSKGQPVTYALKARSHYGTIAIRMAINADIFSIKIEKGESLERRDGLDELDPCCRVMFKGRSLGSTPACENTVAPIWTRGNVFSIPVKEVLEEETRILELLKQDDKAQTPQGRALKRIQNVLSNRKQSVFGIASPMTRQERRDRKTLMEELNARALFVIELYDHNYLTPNELVGHVRVPIDALRRMVPTTPVNTETVSKGRSLSHMVFRVAALSSRLARKVAPKLPTVSAGSKSSGVVVSSKYTAGGGNGRGGKGNAMGALLEGTSSNNNEEEEEEEGEVNRPGRGRHAVAVGASSSSSSTSNNNSSYSSRIQAAAAGDGKFANTNMASLLDADISEESSMSTAGGGNIDNQSLGSDGGRNNTTTPMQSSGGANSNIRAILSSETAPDETPEMARIRRLTNKPLPPSSGGNSSNNNNNSSSVGKKGSGNSNSKGGGRGGGAASDSDSDRDSSDAESQQVNATACLLMYCIDLFI